MQDTTSHRDAIQSCGDTLGNTPAETQLWLEVDLHHFSLVDASSMKPQLRRVADKDSVFLTSSFAKHAEEEEQTPHLPS